MRPPPLNTLLAFEFAARLGSYTRAAAELHVTHSAISQQIRSLESQLGVTLFTRSGRQMVLTAEGEFLNKRISPALLQIKQALAEINASGRAPSITVTTLQSFANRWLLPRLRGFQKLLPHVEVHIHASPDLKDIERGHADIAIRYGAGNWKGCHAEPLLEEWLFPVCSPSFNRGRLPQQPGQLKRYRVLRDDCQIEWDAWSRAAGIDHQDLVRCSSYSDSNLMLGAAAAGHGIAIGRSTLVSADLAAGRLVRVCEPIAPSPYFYHLVTAVSRTPPPHLQAFIDWLHKEAARFARSERRVLGISGPIRGTTRHVAVRQAESIALRS